MNIRQQIRKVLLEEIKKDILIEGTIHSIESIPKIGDEVVKLSISDMYVMIYTSSNTSTEVYTEGTEKLIKYYKMWNEYKKLKNEFNYGDEYITKDNKKIKISSVYSKLIIEKNKEPYFEASIDCLDSKKDEDKYISVSVEDLRKMIKSKINEK